MNFAFFSANLHHFISSIPFEDHEDLFLRFKKYHSARNPAEYRAKVAGLDRHMPAGILAVFHLGHHELLPLYLAEAGIDFDILISRKVYHKYEDRLMKHQKTFKLTARHFNFLFAEDANVIFSLRKSLHAGKHILLFADGNLGSDAPPGQLLPLAFFERILHVRTGIAFISYLLRVPIYPLLDQECNGTIEITAQPKLFPSVRQTRADYIKDAMQQLFDLLSHRLNESCTDWGCWDYLHRNGMLRLEEPSEILPRYSLHKYITVFSAGEKLFALDRENYNIYII